MDSSWIVDAGQFVAAVLASYAAAGALFLVLKRQARWRTYAFALLEACVLASPLLIAADNPPLRFAASLNAIVVAVKLFIALRHPSLVTGLSLGGFLASLSNVFDLYFAHDPRIKRQAAVDRHDWATLLWRGAVFVLCFGLWIAVCSRDWGEWPAALEFTARTVSLFAWVVAVMQLVAQIYWMLGISGMLFTWHVFLSATPAEFWRRWNRPSQQFLYQDAYLPLRGVCRPLAAIMAVFAINGLVHEYVLGIPIGQATGYQLCFFLIQGIAVAATAKVRPSGWRRIVGIALTWVFMISSSALFFVNFDRIFPPAVTVGPFDPSADRTAQVDTSPAR